MLPFLHTARAIEAYVPSQVPSAVLACYRGDTLVCAGAWGAHDPATPDQSATLGTLYDIASLTKLYTATLFLAYVSAGKVSLDTPLVDVLPSFGAFTPRPLDGGQDPHSKQHLPLAPERAGMTADPAQVTFWHLLTHTSGLPAWRDVYSVAPPPPPPNQPDPHAGERWAKGVQALCAYPFVGLPSEGVVRYSDIGLMLLGEAVRVLSGKNTLEEAFNAHFAPEDCPLFNPVRAHNLPLAHIAPTEDDRTWRKRRVWGEVHDENACGLGGVAAHAGAFATVEQVVRLGVRWLMQDPTLGITPELMRLATQERAQTNGERRGLGWMIRSHQGSSAGDGLSLDTYGHTGFTGTSLYIDPVKRVVVALLTNAVYVGREHMPTYALRRAVHNAIAEDIA